MTTLSIILRHADTGRVTLVTQPQATWSDPRKAEAEASRMRLRDEACSFCVYTGLFENVHQAAKYAELLSKGAHVTDAYRQANPGAHRSL